MIELKELLLYKLFPKHLQTAHLQALSYACQKWIEIVLQYSNGTMLFANVEDLGETELDLMAAMLHAPYYKSDLDVELKRELVKNAVRYRNLAGKNMSIQEILALFYGEIDVEDWYEYNGEPYHFQLISKDKVLTPEMVRECMQMISLLKRVTANYDGMRFKKDIDIYEYAGVFFHVNDYMCISQQEDEYEV